MLCQLSYFGPLSIFKHIEREEFTTEAARTAVCPLFRVPGLFHYQGDEPGGLFEALRLHRVRHVLRCMYGCPAGDGNIRGDHACLHEDAVVRPNAARNARFLEPKKGLAPLTLAVGRRCFVIYAFSMVSTNVRIFRSRAW